jgi:putative peptidoglycan lipid II flippase
MGFRLMGLVVLPASAILFVLARPIVNALLDYGSFTARDGAATAETLAMFSIGLFSFSAYLFTLRGFYAMQDTRTPFLLNCLENGINIVLAFALYPAMGVEGLALSWSIAYIVATVVALRAMRHRLQRLEGRAILQTFVRVGIATLLLAGIAWLVATVIGYDTPVRAIAATTAALALGGTVFYLALRAMHVRELTDLTSAIRRRPLAA